MDLGTLLKLVELFRGLSDTQRERIMGIGQEQIYQAGDVVVAQGSEGDEMYIIGSGQVEVQIEASGGVTHSAIYLGEGQIFGEMALIDRGKRSASVVVIENDTTIFRLPADQFTGLCMADTAIGYIMMRNLAQDLSFKLRYQNLLNN